MTHAGCKKPQEKAVPALNFDEHAAVAAGIPPEEARELAATDDILSMTDDEIDAELRAAGQDPVAVGDMGLVTVYLAQPTPPSPNTERAFAWLRHWVDEGDQTSDRTASLTALLDAVRDEAIDACIRECAAERDEWQADYDLGTAPMLSKIGMRTAQDCMDRLRRMKERSDG